MLFIYGINVGYIPLQCINPSKYCDKTTLMNLFSGQPSSSALRMVTLGPYKMKTVSGKKNFSWLIIYLGLLSIIFSINDLFLINGKL